jgi:hypothetical protein
VLDDLTPAVMIPTAATTIPTHLDLAADADVGAILALKARYITAINDKNWDDVGHCLAADASVAFEDGRYSYDGRAQIVEYLRASLDLIYAEHVASNPRISLGGPSEAQGDWDLSFAWHDPWDNTTLRGSGVYTDRYVKTDSGWVISFTGIALTTDGG